MKRIALIFVSVVLLLAQLSGCSSKGNSFDNADVDIGYNKDSYYPTDQGGAYPDLSEDMASDNVNDLGERKIIKNANINFETKTYDEFMDQLMMRINSNGGYVEFQESRGNGVYEYSASRYSRLIVRIPASSYDSFMTSIDSIGSVVSINESQDDVTMDYIDTESRIKALETEYNALLAILEKSDNVKDIIDLQSRISNIIYQLDSYKSQLRKYDDLIAYCTVRINVSEVERETPDIKVMSFGDKIVAGLGNTLEDIAGDLSDFAVWFVVTLPYMLIWAIIIAVIVILIKLIANRSRKKMEIKKAAKAYKEYINDDQN